MAKFVKVNMRDVNRSLSRNKIFNSELRKNILKKVENSKTALIKEFNLHPVTREIERGVSSQNVSGTLGGYGNLFTFIGFPFGSTPIHTVREMLRRIKVGRARKSTFTQKGVKTEVEIDIPSKEAITAATPMPWEQGRSWLYGIETGISGFGSYMYKKWRTSRSGHGVQAKTHRQQSKKIRGGGFKNTTYFSSMLLAFTKRIR